MDKMSLFLSSCFDESSADNNVPALVCGRVGDMGGHTIPLLYLLMAFSDWSLFVYCVVASATDWW